MLQTNNKLKIQLFLLIALLLISPCAFASWEGNQISAFTFAERGEEIGRLYRLGLEKKQENIEIFCAALKSPDPEVRKAAAAQLVFTHDKSALDALIEALHDPSTLVRRCAIASLEKIGSTKAIPALKEQLTYFPQSYLAENGDKLPLPREEYFNRLAAALALFRLGDNSGAQTVTELLRTSEYPKVLTMALNAATLMDLKEAIPEAIRIAWAGKYFGEESPALFAMRMLRILSDSTWADKLIPLVLAKMEAPGNYVKMEGMAILSKWGDSQAIPLFKRAIQRSNPQLAFWALKGMQRLHPEGAEEFIAENYFRTGGGPFFRGNQSNLLSFKVACEAIASFGEPKVTDHLNQLYQQLSQPVDHFTHRLYLAWSMAELGDARGFEYLQEALLHEDAAVRRLATKFLGRLQHLESLPLLLQAIKRETETFTFKMMKETLASFEPLPEEVKRLTSPSSPQIEDTDDEMRYMIMYFDDCATIEAMERFTWLMEELAGQGARWVFTMYSSPLSRHDYEYNTVLMQRCFDRGCEIENHTLYHSPELRGILACNDDQLREEIVGCNTWLRSNIKGLDKIYDWKAGGGGGSRRQGDPRRTWDEVGKIVAEGNFTKDIRYRKFEYNHTHKRTLWPEVTAPPVHLTEQDIFAMLREDRSILEKNNYLVGDRPGSDLYNAYDFDTVEEGIEAYAASLDDWYHKSPENIFVFGGHDFPASPILYRAGFDKRWEIQEGFLKRVLLKKKAQYPHLYSVTTLEMSHIYFGQADPELILNRKRHLQTNE